MVDTSKYFPSTLISFTLAAQLLINPSTKISSALYQRHSSLNKSGVCDGITMVAWIPALAQYAAMAAPALPAVGIMQAFIPASRALEIAMQRPLALKDPVGFMPSSFIQTEERSVSLPRRVLEITGVKPSPKEIRYFG